MNRDNIFSKFIFSYFNFKISNSKFFYQKKAITPVVATALLLVVAVISVVGFQGWFQTFSSSTLVKVEQEGSYESINTLIDSVIDSNLYFKNGYSNITISDIQIDGTSCGVNPATYSNGLKKIDIRNCTLNASSSTSTIIVITNKGIFSKIINLKNNLNTPSINLNCSILKGGEWSLVPGDITYSTSNFCVMKYEAKWNGSGTINDGVNMYCGNGNNYNSSTACPVDGSVGVESKAADTPLRNVNQFEAIKLCKTLGTNYHLITNNEWMTIARNAETVSSNWADGEIGSTVVSGGGLKRGNVGIIDSTSYSGGGPESGTGRNTKALLNLSNGEGIWDLSGNFWEWTSDSIDCSGGYSCVNMPYDITPASEWIELTNINSYGSLSYDFIRPSNSTWNSSYGMGQMYTDNDASWPNDASWNTTHAFLRGGAWGDGGIGGIFSYYFYNGPSNTAIGFGFRCAYTP